MSADVEPVVRLIMVSVPPRPLRRRLEALRDELARASGAAAALAYPPHLTLRTGALVPRRHLADFLTEFRHWAALVPPFEVRLEALAASALPADGRAGGGAGFIGFAVAADPALMAAHRRLAEFETYRKGPQYEYRPHVTLAFDDIDPERAHALGEGLRGRPDLPVGAAWTCRAVECCALRDGRWRPVASLPLAPG